MIATCAAAAGVVLLLLLPAGGVAARTTPAGGGTGAARSVILVTGILLATWVAGAWGAVLRVLPPPGVVIVLAGGCWVALLQVRARRSREVTERRGQAVVDFCDALAADLRAGQPPFSALQAGVVDWPELRPVADAARLGGDIPSAFRLLAQQPGAGGLDSVAAGWAIAHRSGAGLADAISLAGRVIRESRASARLVETELASARATARMLAVLPFGVLLIGRGAGGDPFGFLLGTTAGTLCLSAGLALIWAGLSWLERIARSVRG